MSLPWVYHRSFGRTVSATIATISPTWMPGRQRRTVSSQYLVVVPWCLVSGGGGGGGGIPSRSTRPRPTTTTTTQSRGDTKYHHHHHHHQHQVRLYGTTPTVQFRSIRPPPPPPPTTTTSTTTLKQQQQQETDDPREETNLNSNNHHYQYPRPAQHDHHSSSSSASSSWVDRLVPTSMQPYAKLARMDKPIGSMLLLWPCYWSLAVAAGPGALPDVSLLTLFGIGAVVMRGAGCTINDMWDASLDAKVARTRTRPLPAGDVHMTHAAVFLVAQLAVGLCVLLSLPQYHHHHHHTDSWYAFQWACASLPLVALYPSTKRFFPYPQVILGLAFNWGAILGWAVVHGSIDWSIIAPLYGSGVTWTVVYDTLYAHQDKEDDAKLSLRSTALSFGDKDETQRQILHGLAALTYMQWLTVGATAELAWLPYSVGATAAYSHLVWQIQTAEFDNPSNLAHRFRSNNVTGGILFTALTTGTYFAATAGAV